MHELVIDEEFTGILVILGWVNAYLNFDDDTQCKIAFWKTLQSSLLFVQSLLVSVRDARCSSESVMFFEYSTDFENY